MFRRGDTVAASSVMLEPESGLKTSGEEPVRGNTTHYLPTQHKHNQRSTIRDNTLTKHYTHLSCITVTLLHDWTCIQLYSPVERCVESLWQDCGVSDMLEESDSRLRGVLEREVPCREKARVDMGERSGVNWGDSPLNTLRYKSRPLIVSLKSSSSL